MTSLNLATLLRESARDRPDHPAVIAGRVTLTYAELLDQARRLASGLAALGVERGQHVALLFTNVPHFTVSYFACHFLGCPVVPLNALLTAEEILFHLDDSDAVLLIAASELCQMALPALARAETCRRLVVGITQREDVLLPPGTEVLDALIDGHEPIADTAATAPDDTAVVLYTSGTTGRSKGAELTHFNLYWNAQYMARHFMPDGAGTVTLGVLPLFHSFGQTVIQNATISVGGTAVLLPRFEAQAALEAISQHHVTFVAGVPTMYMALLRHPKADEIPLSSLTCCISGGAPMPVEVLREFESKHGIGILEGYGLSETSPVASQNRRDRPIKPGSIGLPLRDVDFKLVDEGGREVRSADESGEIWIRGPVVMKGYYKRPEATAQSITDGWFRTGDIARRDDDGYYYIVDRKKDMIIRSGYKVYPREVEEVLYAHPAVAEAAVIGVPHARLGEEVKAVVVLKRGVTASADDLIAYCRERVAVFKYPRIVEFVDSLPKGPTGKILKRALRPPA